jgi:hypothetical protein
MAPRFKTKLHTFSGSWESLQGIFAAQDLLTDDYTGSFSVRAARTNIDDVVWADSDGGEGGFLAPTEAAAVELDNKFVRATDVFFRSTAGHKAYFTYLAP